MTGFAAQDGLDPPAYPSATGYARSASRWAPRRPEDRPSPLNSPAVTATTARPVLHPRTRKATTPMIDLRIAVVAAHESTSIGEVNS